MNGNSVNDRVEMVLPNPPTVLLEHSSDSKPDSIRVSHLFIQQSCVTFHLSNIFQLILPSVPVVFPLLSEDKNEWR